MLVVLMNMTVMIHLISWSSIRWQGIHVKGVTGLFGRMFPGMIRHELSLVVLLHMRPSQTRRLDNIRVLCQRLESSSRLPAPATCTPLEIYQYTMSVGFEPTTYILLVV